MGKLDDLRLKYNKYINNQYDKSKKNITGIKNYYSSLSYNMSKNQINPRIRKYAAIAGVAAALAIGGITVNNVYSHDNAYENQNLQKDVVMEEANSWLKELCVR